MDLFHIGFLNIRLLDLIDILLVAYLLYRMYALLKGGVAINIIIGILLIYALYWLFTNVMHMQMLSTILGQFIGVGFIALIIVFQQEVRRFLILLGSNTFPGKSAFGKQFISWNWKTENMKDLTISPVINACKNLSKSHTGGIIVIAKASELKFYSNTGDILDAEVSKRLIETIFSKSSPLHDGAIIISQNKIKAARCVLPISENHELPAHLGMRHRAAIGITEQTDALAIVVSEQSGEISYSVNGDINLNITVEELERKLQSELN
ncbi:MAG: diadenylate cyclase CdaA [Bacteroidota bacterium]